MARKYVNTRSSVLREELRSLVLHASPGTKLPSETQLVKKYHVARMTVGKALHALEEEGLLERRHGCGTFVKGKRVVTLLLPCPGFLNEEFNPYNYLYSGYLQGALQAVSERGMSLKMIAVSLTNNRDDIQYSLLSELGDGAMVICTIWFRLLYNFLISRGVRIALMGIQHESYGYRQYHQYFCTVDADRQSAIQSILDGYYRQGKRRIALAGSYLSEKSHPLRSGYLDWCKLHQMPELLYDFPELDSQAPYPDGLLTQLHQRDAFDAIVIHHIGFCGAQGSIQEYLGLPADVAVFGFEFSLHNSPRLHPFPTCVPNAWQMAYDAVVALDEKRPLGTVQTVAYEFKNPPQAWADDWKHKKIISTNNQIKE